jgi:AcrR family transcriptional regulator
VPTRRREPLTRARILDAAIELADRDGLEALSMRRLGQHLGVEAMSLYKHVADKEDVLAGIADQVAQEFALPDPSLDWRAALRATSLTAYDVLRRHPWAGPLLESTLQPGPARLAYLDAVVGVLRAAGFSLPETAHAFGSLDSHLYGFTMQVASWPFDAEDSADVAIAMASQLPEETYPNIVAMARHVADTGRMPIDFEFGLDLILDGLERQLRARRSTARPR